LIDNLDGLNGKKVSCEHSDKKRRKNLSEESLDENSNSKKSKSPRKSSKRRNKSKNKIEEEEYEEEEQEQEFEDNLYDLEEMIEAEEMNEVNQEPLAQLPKNEKKQNNGNPMQLGGFGKSKNTNDNINNNLNNTH